MSRRAARVLQADIARARRAAKQTGGGVVEIHPDGIIKIVPEDQSQKRREPEPADEDEEIVL